MYTQIGVHISTRVSSGLLYVKKQERTPYKLGRDREMLYVVTSGKVMQSLVANFSVDCKIVIEKGGVLLCSGV